MIGEVFGSYRVIAKLGAGGMGTVWIAEHKLLGSRAAIKVLQPGMSSQEKIVQRFFDEARAASRIRDPGIVTVIDFGWHGGDAYIVMELLSGGTLTQRLGLAQMPPLRAMRLVQMSALAMAAAHARGIIHRDLKPDNIFVVNDPAVPGGERVKILDFGIAKLLDRDPDSTYLPTVDGTIMGTPAYMSPEQCRAATNSIDHRTDVYSLGCVLFHLLCGRPPFIAQTQGDMIVAQIQELPPHPTEFVANLAPEIDALVMRCLAKNPDDRFQTMTDIVRAGAAITGDNHTIDTIPPMLASELVASPATLASIYYPPWQPAGTAGIVGTPSQSGEMAAVAVRSGITTPPVTTLHGSATALDTASAIHRPRYGVAALLILGVAGGIALAMVFGRHDEQRSAEGQRANRPDAQVIVPTDAAEMAAPIVPTDAAQMAAPIVPIIDAGAIPIDAPPMGRPRRLDAGASRNEYDHR